ncbi:hypothetical protein PR048_008452 [Dryococelus australis]|uniref:DUF4371 domain-containing protein n=1 Tax=Dryococelus australis TaxID=614101 RepID=A0ABQ9HX58_9NEOP|nr:hypothetical protein PR048_008452 [Dryococelus australis]
MHLNDTGHMRAVGDPGGCIRKFGPDANSEKDSGTSTSDGDEGHQWALGSEVSKEQRRNARAGETGDPEKTRRPAASYGTVLKCENPGASPPGIEPGSPGHHASIEGDSRGGSIFDRFRILLQSMLFSLCGRTIVIVASKWLAACGVVLFCVYANTNDHNHAALSLSAPIASPSNSSKTPDPTERGLSKHKRNFQGHWTASFPWLVHDHTMDTVFCKPMSHSVLKQLITCIKYAVYCAVIVNETSDIAIQEKVYICFRIVTRKFEIRELFVDFYVADNTLADTLHRIAIDILQRFGPNLSNCRGQCFDGVSDMAGIYAGVQSRISEIESRTLFVHCLAHSLNLSVQETVKHLTVEADKKVQYLRVQEGPRRCLVVTLLASHLGELGSTPVFSRVGIVPSDVAGWRVFSAITRLPPPLHSGTALTFTSLHPHRLSRPRFALNLRMGVGYKVGIKVDPGQGFQKYPINSEQPCYRLVVVNSNVEIVKFFDERCICVIVLLATSGQQTASALVSALTIHRREVQKLVRVRLLTRRALNTRGTDSMPCTVPIINTFHEQHVPDNGPGD